MVLILFLYTLFYSAYKGTQKKAFPQNLIIKLKNRRISLNYPQFIWSEPIIVLILTYQKPLRMGIATFIFKKKCESAIYFLELVV